MTSSQEKCGLSSLLPMSCRERAEAFARHLHSRLTSLDSEEKHDVGPSESTWITAHENSVTLSQPKHCSEIKSINDEFYLDLGTLESPSSPAETTDESEFGKYINEERLPVDYNIETNLLNDDSDSSDGPFYDTQELGDNSLHISKKQDLNDNIYKTSAPDNEESSYENYSLSENELQLPDSDVSLTQVCVPLTSSPKNTNELLTSEKQISNNDSSTVKISIQLEATNTVQSSKDDDDYETEEKTPRVRRCSSLKTGKTPPGTPGQKKIVHFADVLGLDLADVRTFLDEIPKIPNSAFNDLKDVDIKSSTLNTTTKIHNISVQKILLPLFQQPGGQSDFIDRLRKNQVCLDNAVVEDASTLSVSGIVRVKNLDFHKSVHIRYTLDSWLTFADVPATYVDNSCDGFSDKFTFLLFASNLAVGGKLEFAVRFQCKGCQYWDNNYGKNYCFQCLPAKTTSSAIKSIDVPDDSLSTSFY